MVMPQRRLANSYIGPKAGMELVPDRQATGSEVLGPGLEPRGGTSQSRTVSMGSRTVPLTCSFLCICPPRAQDSAGRILARVPNSSGESPASQPLLWFSWVRWAGGGEQQDTALGPVGVILSAGFPR